MPLQGFPGGLDGKESACSVGDLGREDSPGEGNGYPLRYSCLGNHMDRGAWQATVSWGCKRVRHDLVTKQQPFFRRKGS